MTDAREIIAEAAKEKLTLDGFSPYDEMAAHIVDTLNAAGFRILNPNEVDAMTEAWRPIETAPKDGTWVMLWRGHTNFGCRDPLIIGKWFEWREGDASWVWPDGPYDPYTETGRADADVDIASGHHYESNEFTHWMPLPTPPALAQEGK